MNSAEKIHFAQIHGDIEDIKGVLLGDEYSTGVTERIKLMEERLSVLERTLDRVRYLLIGLSLFGLGSLYDIAKSIFYVS